MGAGIRTGVRIRGMRKGFSLLRCIAFGCAALAFAQTAAALPVRSGPDAETPSASTVDDPTAETDEPPPLTAAEWREMEGDLPPLQGRRYRYPQMGLFARIAVDIPAMPASVVDWNDTDWTIFSSVMGSGVALMLPFNPSMDASFQQWVNSNRDPYLDDLFPLISDKAMSIATVAYIGVWWGVGWISDDETVLELASLTSEALAVAQFYHVSLKLLTGREGPHDGEGLGIVHGFTSEFYPDGTPSGHTATVTAVFSVLAEYYDNWAMRGAVVAGAAYMGASLIYTNEHFFSDVIFGGAIGYAVGSFVVRNRSTRYRYGDNGESQYIAVMPLQLPNGGGGVQLVGTW